MTKPVFLAIDFDSDEVMKIMQFQTHMRGSALPFGAKWVTEPKDGEVLGWWTRDPTELNFINEIERAFPPVNARGERQPRPLSWRVIDPSDIPADRTFRDALTHDGEKLTHDMGKARAIKLGHLREERADKLATLDVEFTRATGQKDTVEADAVEAKRQALRDMTVTLAPAIEAAKTVDELKAVTLDG